jgi:hypothetical protein
MKNKSAQALGRLSAKRRDTSSKAMRELVNKRWEKEREKKLMEEFIKDHPWIQDDDIPDAFDDWVVYNALKDDKGNNN